MKLTLTGTSNPLPNPERAGPGQVVEIGGDRLLVDCGDRTTTQLMLAGINPWEVTELFITHMHHDHNLGLSTFVIGGWSLGREELTIWGPEGTAAHVNALFGNAFRPDLEERFTFGRPREGIENIQVREFGADLRIERPGYTVTACRVKHMIETYALRFDDGEKSLVLSSDTAYCQELVEFAKGAHTLVHECTRVRGTRSLGVRRERTSGSRNSAHFHATPEDAGQVAAEAGVSRLVLTHFGGYGPDPAEVRDRCKSVFEGEVIPGEDLMVIDI